MEDSPATFLQIAVAYFERSMETPLTKYAAPTQKHKAAKLVSTSEESGVKSYKSQVKSHKSRVTSQELQVTSQESQVMSHKS